MSRVGLGGGVGVDIFITQTGNEPFICERALHVSAD